jgi:hypothetical protein
MLEFRLCQRQINMLSPAHNENLSLQELARLYTVHPTGGGRRGSILLYF